jgi:hypothetical protein
MLKVLIAWPSLPKESSVPGGAPDPSICQRATWPRYRYDQLMNLGWKRLIPLGMAAVLANAVVGMVKG